MLVRSWARDCFSTRILSFTPPTTGAWPLPWRWQFSSSYRSVCGAQAPVAGNSRVFLWRVAGITLFAVGAVVWLMERRAAAAPIAPETLSAVAVEELLDRGN